MNKDLTYLHRFVRLEILCGKYKWITTEYRPSGESWIEHFRKGLRMSQTQLGRLAGVSKQAVSKLEERRHGRTFVKVIEQIS